VRGPRIAAVTARAAFAELGPGAPLDIIARRAGVGSATLYRRFPTREVLIEAVYRHDIDVLINRALELAEHCPPLEALERWVREEFVPAQQRPGLAATLNDALAAAPEVFSETKQRLNDAAKELVCAAQADGTLRPDVETRDVLRLAAGIAHTSAGAPEACRRMLTVVFDGLRAARPESSPQLTSSPGAGPRQHLMVHGGPAR
jgi:AcrR family transcriptional regulator